MSSPRIRLPVDGYDLIFMTSLLLFCMVACTVMLATGIARTNVQLELINRHSLAHEATVNAASAELCEECSTACEFDPNQDRMVCENNCEWVPCDDWSMDWSMSSYASVGATPIQWREGTFVRDKDHYTQATFKELQLAVAHLENEQGAVRGDIAKLRDRMAHHQHNQRPYSGLQPRTQ